MVVVCEYSLRPRALSPPQRLPMGNFLIIFPRALPLFPLPRPTAKKPLRSKQHERGLCGGERFQSLRSGKDEFRVDQGLASINHVRLFLILIVISYRRHHHRCHHRIKYKVYFNELSLPVINFSSFNWWGH